MPVALTIAGSDSGGGAGLQADLRAFRAAGIAGATAVSCVTAQNPSRVRTIFAMPSHVVADQVRAVCDFFRVRAVKTGMLYTGETVRTVARLAKDLGFPNLVVDPVLRATSGALLARSGAPGILRRELIPLARVVTPNVPEAEVLWGGRIGSVTAMREAARGISMAFGVACVIKGGHLADDAMATDVLYWRGWREFRGTRLRTAGTHGTGCAFSASLAAWLGRGLSLENGVARAKRYVIACLKNG
jgi:hydroxymethylpyrimidine/phosphomethylpyrimidine kinase